MIFTDGWQSSYDIHETINYCYDQIWEITIALKLSYDLPHEPVPKLMSSHDLVPFATNLQLVRDTRPYANVHGQFATKCKVFVHNTVVMVVTKVFFSRNWRRIALLGSLLIASATRVTNWN